MLKEALQKFGLPDKEALIYLALLELGKAKVQDIARKTKLPRSTIYSVLGFLEEKGLTFSFEQKKIKLFTAQDPQKILFEATARAETIKEILPELKQLHRASKARPQMKYYEGVSEIKRMYESILKEKELKSYDIISAEEHWRTMDPKFFDSFKIRRAKANIKTRLLLEHSPTALERKAQEADTYSEVKIIPPGMGIGMTAGCYIFKHKVIFIAYKEERVAVEIFSSEIASLMKVMFEFMWRFLAK